MLYIVSVKYIVLIIQYYYDESEVMTMKEIMEFFKRGFYYMWRADLIIFLVVVLGILLLFIVAWIKGIIRKHKKITDNWRDTKNP